MGVVISIRGKTKVGTREPDLGNRESSLPAVFKGFFFFPIPYSLLFVTYLTVIARRMTYNSSNINLGGTRMQKVKRNMVKINQELCNGCGRCVSPCAESAIEIVNGKARVIRDELCDGAGFCLGVCPTGALSIEKVETVPFSEEAVHEHKQKLTGTKAAEQEITMK
jgi:ferredoxin